MDQDGKGKLIANADVNDADKNDKPLIDLIEFANIKNKDLVGKMISIIELCSNPERYEYNCSSKTKKFWAGALEEEHLYSIFQGYSPETLKKYWAKIRKSGDAEEFFHLIVKNKELINNSKRSLGSIIDCVSDFIKNNVIGDFQDFFQAYSTSKKNKKNGKIKLLK